MQVENHEFKGLIEVRDAETGLLLGFAPPADTFSGAFEIRIHQSPSGWVDRKAKHDAREYASYTNVTLRQEKLHFQHWAGKSLEVPIYITTRREWEALLAAQRQT